MSNTPPPPVSPRKVMSIFENVSKSVSPPGSKSIEYIRKKMPELFNLSINDFVDMSNDKTKLEFALKLLKIDKNDKDSVKKTKQFIKYIASIPEAKSKTSRELSELIDKKKYSDQLKYLPDDVKQNIYGIYKSITTPVHKLRNWIDSTQLNQNGLIVNPSPGAIEILKKYIKDPELAKKHCMNWNKLLKNENPEAIKLLEFLDPHTLNKFNWKYLSKNKGIGAIEYLKKNPDKIIWDIFLQNPSAVEYLRTIYANNNHRYDEYYSKIDWEYLYLNPNPLAKDLLLKYLEKHNMNISGIDIELQVQYNESHLDGYKEKVENILDTKTNLVEHGHVDLIEYEFDPDNDEEEEYDPDEEIDDYIDDDFEQHEWESFWESLSKDPKEIELITKILTNDRYKYIKHHINWHYLSENNKAIKFLKTHQYKIDWTQFSKNSNPEAIKLLKNNQDKIDWYNFSTNPSIFVECVP